MTQSRRKTAPIVVAVLLAIKAAVLLVPDLLRVAPDVARAGPDVVRALPVGPVEDSLPVLAQDDWGRIADAAVNGADVAVDAVGLVDTGEE